MCWTRSRHTRSSRTQLTRRRHRCCSSWRRPRTRRLGLARAPSAPRRRIMSAARRRRFSHGAYALRSRTPPRPNKKTMSSLHVLRARPPPPSLPSSSSSSLSSLAPCPSSSSLLRPPGSSHRVLRVSTFGCHVSPPVRSCEYRQAAAAVYLSLQDTQDASLDTFKAFAPVVVQGQGGELDSLGKNLSQRRDFAPARSDTDLPRQALDSM